MHYRLASGAAIAYHGTSFTPPKDVSMTLAHDAIHWDCNLQSTLPGRWLDARADEAALALATTRALRQYGFALVRGLDPDPGPTERDRVAPRLNRFGAALGTIIRQNRQGSLLEDIRDFSDTDAFDNRGYRSPGELSLHTDPPSMLVLHCLRPARSGGDNTLVNVQAMHGHMARHHPELLRELERGFRYWIPSETEAGAGEASPWRRPVLMVRDGLVSCVYYRPYIEMAAQAAGEPLSPLAVRALDTYDGLAGDARFQIQLRLAAGDTMVLHNRAVLHARGAYEDWPDASRRRHLLRLWIDAPAIRPAQPEHDLGDFFAEPATA